LSGSRRLTSSYFDVVLVWVVEVQRISHAPCAERLRSRSACPVKRPVAKRNIRLGETPMDRLECGALQAERQMHLVLWHLLHQVKREPCVHSQNVKRVGSAFVPIPDTPRCTASLILFGIASRLDRAGSLLSIKQSRQTPMTRLNRGRHRHEAHLRIPIHSLFCHGNAVR
jgi:hypothetical protein